MPRVELLMWLWVIFIIEGDCRASVPFGWLKRKAEWRARKIGFRQIMIEVAREIKREWAKWQKAQTQGDKRDFAAWLAQVGYNANPAEAATWEKNARAIYRLLQAQL